MKRSDREVMDKAQIDSFIYSCRVVRLGLVEDCQPYIVPMCFGYDGESIFVHCANSGRRMDMLAANDRVCFEFDEARETLQSEQACSCSISYTSVVGYGTARILQDIKDKEAGLSAITRQYSGSSQDYPANMLNATTVIRIAIDSMSCKRRL